VIGKKNIWTKDKNKEKGESHVWNQIFRKN